MVDQSDSQRHLNYSSQPQDQSHSHFTPSTSLSESHCTHDETDNDREYKRLLESFQELAQVSDPIKLEFELVTAARSHKLPISSYRKMFGSWLTSQQKGGPA